MPRPVSPADRSPDDFKSSEIGKPKQRKRTGIQSKTDSVKDKSLKGPEEEQVVVTKKKKKLKGRLSKLKGRLSKLTPKGIIKMISAFFEKYFKVGKSSGGTKEITPDKVEKFRTEAEKVKTEVALWELEGKPVETQKKIITSGRRFKFALTYLKKGDLSEMNTIDKEIKKFEISEEQVRTSLKNHTLHEVEKDMRELINNLPHLPIGIGSTVKDGISKVLREPIKMEDWNKSIKTILEYVRKADTYSRNNRLEIKCVVFVFERLRDAVNSLELDKLEEIDIHSDRFG